LKTKDIVYRIERAGIKMVVCIAEDGVPQYFDEAEEQLSQIKLIRALVGDENREGWLNFRGEIQKASSEFKRPSGDQKTSNNEPTLVYFSSGTTGLPKMVEHDYTYPFGHIITAKYWQ